MDDFVFVDPGRLADDELQLELSQRETAEISIWKAPTYRFEIRSSAGGTRIGHINLRVGETHVLTHYAGHIGYGIDEAFRGRHYAERAVRLLLPFVARHGMRTVWITTAPDNAASRRTLERLGAAYCGVFDVPPEYPLPPGANPQKCRYLLDLPPMVYFRS